MVTRWTIYLATAMLAGAAEGVLLTPRPVAAVARDVWELQEGLKQLIQAQKETETTLAQNAAVNKTLIEQSMDAVNKMSGNMTDLEKTAQEMQAASGARMDTMATQTKVVSDNAQVILESMSKLNQQLVDLQNALRGVDAKLDDRPPAPSAARPVTRVRTNR